MNKNTESDAKVKELKETVKKIDIELEEINSRVVVLKEYREVCNEIIEKYENG